VWTTPSSPVSSSDWSLTLEANFAPDRLALAGLGGDLHGNGAEFSGLGSPPGTLPKATRGRRADGGTTTVTLRSAEPHDR